MYQFTEIYTHFFFYCMWIFFPIDHMLSKSKISVQLAQLIQNPWNYNQTSLSCIQKHTSSVKNISYNCQNIRQYVKTPCIKSQRQINNSLEHHLPGLNSDQNLPLLCRGLGLLLTPDHFWAPKSRQHHAFNFPWSRGSSLGALLLLLCWHVFADAWETRKCRKKIESLFPDAWIDRSVGLRRRCWGSSGDTGHRRYRIDFLLGINQITGKRDRNILIISFTPRFVRDF